MCDSVVVTIKDLQIMISVVNTLERTIIVDKFVLDKLSYKCTTRFATRSEPQQNKVYSYRLITAQRLSTRQTSKSEEY